MQIKTKPQEGINGSFILGDNGECIVLNSDSPAGELQIIYNYDDESPLRTTFTITTGTGYRYTFGHIDTCTSSGSWGAEDETPESEASISCWKLTRIESNLGMKAEFIYQGAGNMETITNSACLDNLTLTDDNEMNPQNFARSLKENRNKFDFEGTRALMLKRITYPTGGHSEYHYEQNSYTSKPGRKESIPETSSGNTGTT